MPHSFEKFLIGRSGTLAAAWDHATASAPWAALIKEWVGLTVAVRNTLQLQPSQTSTAIDRESLEKRLAFLGWDLEAKVGPVCFENHARAFFTDLGFRPVANHDSGNAGNCDADLSLLDTVLSRREGAASAIAILFAWAAEIVSKTAADAQNKLSVEFLENVPAHVVRVRTPTNSEYVSLFDAGRKLEAADWISFCNQGTALERLSISDVWIRLMLELRSALDNPSTRWPESAGLRAQLLLLDQLIALRPSLIRLFADRAMLKHRLGDASGALDDLKRFFAFQDRSSAPPALVSLFELLRAGKQPASP